MHTNKIFIAPRRPIALDQMGYGEISSALKGWRVIYGEKFRFEKEH